MPAARRSATGTTIGQPLLDGYRASLLDPGLYHADGQIDGEVYNYGSFLQSKMYRGRGDLLQLPRAAQPEAARRRQRGLRAVPHAQRVRHAGAPFPHAGPARQPVRRLPHAGQDLHGRRSAPRSRLSRPAARPRHRDRCAGHLHHLSRRQGPRLGRGAHRRVVRAGAAAASRVFGQALAADRRAAPGQGRRWSSWPTIRPHRRSPAPRPWPGWSVISTSRRSPRSSAASAIADPMVRLAAVGTLGRARSAVARAGWPCRWCRTRSVRSAWRPPGCWRRSRRWACPPISAQRSRPASPNTRRPRRQLLDRPEGLLTLGNFYRDRGRLPEAEETYATALRLHPGLRAGLCQPRRPAAPAGPRRRWRAHAAAGAGGGAGECRAGACARAPADPAEAVRRRGHGAGQGRQPRARQRPLRLRLCRGAPGDRQAGRGAGRAGAGPCRRIRATRTSSWRWPRGSLQQGDRESALRYAQDLARMAPDDPNVRQLQQALGIAGP